MKQGPTAYLNDKGRVRLTSITMVLKPPHGWQKPIASLVGGEAGASVARYKDEYVAKLRELGGTGEGVEGDITWGGVGGDGTFDSQKMFKVFAKLEPAQLEVDDLKPGEAVSFQ